METRLPKRNELVTVTGPNDFEITGRVVAVRKDNGYTTISVDVDGMKYDVGTGGHLGNTWTMYDGSEQYFVHIHEGK